MKKLILIIICLLSITGCGKKEEKPKKEAPENRSLACHMDENNTHFTVNIEFDDKDRTKSASFIVKTNFKDMYGDIDITDQMKEDLIMDLSIELNEIYNVEYVGSSIDGDNVEIEFSPYKDGEYTMFDEADSSIDGYKNLLNELDFEGFICEKNGIKDVTITDTIKCSTTIDGIYEEFNFDFNQNKDLLRAYVIAKFKPEYELEDGFMSNEEVEKYFSNSFIFSSTPKGYVFNNEVTLSVSIYDYYYNILKYSDRDDEFYDQFINALEKRLDCQ